MLRVPTRTQLTQRIYIGDGDGRGKKAMTLRPPDLSTIKPSKLGTPAWLDCLGGLKQASLIIWLDWLDGQSVS
jgi:hypothetical protein